MKKQPEAETPTRSKRRRVSFEYGNQHIHGKHYVWWVKRNGKDVAGGIALGGIREAQKRSHAVAMALFELEDFASTPLVAKTRSP